MEKTVERLSTDEKFMKLQALLREMGSVCIAFSGGVDSTFLLRVAREVLEERVIAVTAKSPTYPEAEFKEALEIARSIGVRHVVILCNELEVSGFSENRPDRCYLCKRELFTRIRDIAIDNNIQYILDGSNYDDTHDYRPGRKAAQELGVRSPLAEVGLTKQEIRELSRELGLKTWNKPTFACLSSRIPYGEWITEEKLKKIERAEEFLKSLGFTQFRVRSHNGIARLELIPEEMTRLFIDQQLRILIHDTLKGIGFQYVTMDLKGYRTGSMNEVLREDG